MKLYLYGTMSSGKSLWLSCPSYLLVKPGQPTLRQGDSVFTSEPCSDGQGGLWRKCIYQGVWVIHPLPGRIIQGALGCKCLQHLLFRGAYIRRRCLVPVFCLFSLQEPCSVCLLFAHPLADLYQGLIVLCFT